MKIPSLRGYIRSHQERRQSALLHASWPPEVRQAIAEGNSFASQAMSGVLTEQVQAGVAAEKTVPSRQIFAHGSAMLPCYLPSDESPSDDWLHSEKYYPLYHRLFRFFAQKFRTVRMLEIGVRTGYMAVAAMRAIQKPMTYFGVDPNLYLPNGSDLASASLRILREENETHDFCLLEGLSWDAHIQSTLRYSAPFQIIHIDGDHSFEGKLFDLFLAANLISSDGYVLVDDFDHIPQIREAVDCSLGRKWFNSWTKLDTIRGVAILTKLTPTSP